jgi:hypothetical protein
MTDDDKYPFPGPDPYGNPGKEDGDVIEEYAHSCRIVREDKNGYKRYQTDCLQPRGEFVYESRGFRERLNFSCSP